MANQNEPIDFSAISFDDVIGEGAEGLETAEQEPQDVEEYDDDDIVDEDLRIRRRRLRRWCRRI